MARRLRSLTSDRVTDLPEPCPSCTFWESADVCEPSCGCTRDAAGVARWIDETTAAWGTCGKVAYVDGAAVGFVKYAPARFFPQVRHIGAGTPSQDAVVLACLHVDPAAREAGLGKVLVQAALRDLASRRERALEAYAVTEPVGRETSPMITMDFLLRHGFTVLHPDRRYPLMRLELKSLAAWTDNVEAVLESLQLPALRRKRLPSPLGSR